MHNRTKIAILSAISNLIWFVLTLLWNRSRVASLNSEPLFKAWGVYFLVLLTGFLILDVLCAVFIMAREKRSGGQGFGEATDERDRHIEGYAMKAFGTVSFFTFLISACLLAFGQGLHAFFCGLAFMVLLSSLACWLTYIIGYERGL